MKPEISNTHKERFAEIRKRLSLIGSKEESFITIELLFYESLNLAREYGSEPSENELLASLKNLEANEYRTTQGKFAKKAQREKTIRSFISGFKGILATWEKSRTGSRPQLVS